MTDERSAPTADAVEAHEPGCASLERVTGPSGYLDPSEPCDCGVNARWLVACQALARLPAYYPWSGEEGAFFKYDDVLGLLRSLRGPEGAALVERRCPYCDEPGAVIGLHPCIHPEPSMFASERAAGEDDRDVLANA